MELYRNGLKLTATIGLDESRGSVNVPVRLLHNEKDEYLNYTEQIHIRYLFDNQVKEEILPTNDNGFYIPGKPLSHNGPIELAVHLINGDIELVTNELSFVVKNAPNGTTQVDPSEFTWQQLVDQYVNAKLDTFANKLDLSKFEEKVNGSIENQNQNIESFKTEVDTSLSNQTTSINQTTSVQNSKITTLEGRMDTFTSLSEGSTTGDAELKDIRVGANGITYNNAGDAVRGQYSQLKEDLSNEKVRAITRENEIEELFTLPTQEAVNKWLDEHPEATTTVQDGVITEQKMHPDFLLYIKNGITKTIEHSVSYVNVLEKGIRNDGTNISNDLNELLETVPNNTILYFPNGQYGITETITIAKNISFLLDDFAEIKALSIMDKMIYFSADYILRRLSFIGGNLNADYKANTCMAFNGCIGFTLTRTNFLNCGGKALVTETESRVAELQAYNLTFRNVKGVENSVAIYNNGRDNKYTNIVITNFHKAIQSYDGLFNQIHGWIETPSLVVGSEFIRAFDKYVIVNECYSDTFQYSFISESGYMIISNSQVLWNVNIYTEEIANSNTPCVFKCDTGIYQATGLFLAQSVHVSVSLPTKVLNKSSVNSIFINNIFSGQTSKLDRTYYKNQLDNTIMSSGEATGDFNDYTKNGIYAVNEKLENAPTNASNKLILEVTTTKTGLFLQKLYMQGNCEKFYIRSYNGTWSNWRMVSLSAPS